MKHHLLDVDPLPREQGARFVNEPWLVDSSYDLMERWSADPEGESDNVRIYVPVDLNATAILRRLRRVIGHYGDANETNESDFSADVRRLVYQLEIYNQVWFVRSKNMRVGRDHRIIPLSDEGVALAKQFIAELEQIPDGCAETFPLDLIEELKEDFLRID